MTFSHYAGIAIVPTLARLVLAAVFVTAGWNKVRDQDFDPASATRLKNLGVNVETVHPVASAIPNQRGTNGGRVMLTSFSPQNPADAPMSITPPAPDGPASQTSPTGSAAQPPTTTAPGEPLPPGQYRALGMYGIALMLEDHKLSPTMCIWGARLAAFTELLGGAMLLLGLFSRLWGLGLSVTMGVAFYLVSMSMNHIFETNPFVFAQDPASFGTAATQLALFVLAFGVFLTGAGPLSIDRILFGSGGDDETPGVSEG